LNPPASGCKADTLDYLRRRLDPATKEQGLGYAYSNIN